MLLRLDPLVYDALARWAGDELRRANAQIEFLLRRALSRPDGRAGCPAGGRSPRPADRPPRGTGGRPTGSRDPAPGERPPRQFTLPPHRTGAVHARTAQTP